MVPVGAVLPDLEAVFVETAGSDAFEAEARHAIHVGRQDDAVPVDRGVLGEAVAHPQGHVVAFAPAQGRAGQRTVDGHGGGRRAAEVHRGLADEQVETVAGEQVLLARPGQGPGRGAPETQSAEQTGGGEAFDEGASRSSVHPLVSTQVAGRTARACAAGRSRPRQGGAAMRTP
ncbi:Uncharacterised protein [Enterobacter cloacae]|nr:Uncharacterised protein [Enterobacter cloacae]